MTTATSCSWCHAMNSSDERVCAGCGHDAHEARMDCQCPACNPAPRVLYVKDEDDWHDLETER